MSAPSRREGGSAVSNPDIQRTLKPLSCACEAPNRSFFEDQEQRGTFQHGGCSSEQPNRQ